MKPWSRWDSLFWCFCLAAFCLALVQPAHAYGTVAISPTGGTTTTCSFDGTAARPCTVAGAESYLTSTGYWVRGCGGNNRFDGGTITANTSTQFSVSWTVRPNCQGGDGGSINMTGIKTTTTGAGCPANSTGTTVCTCSANYRPNAGATSCETYTCGAMGSTQNADATTRYDMPATGTTSCMNGCIVTPEWQYGTGSNRWATGPWFSMQTTCEGASVATGGATLQPAPDPAPGVQGPGDCASGTCYGTVNGVGQCVPCSATRTDVTTTAATSASGVSTTGARTTTTSVNNPDGSKTTSTTTTNPDGSSTTTTSTGSGSNPIGAYCDRNPTSAMCALNGTEEGTGEEPGSDPTIISGTTPASPTGFYTQKYPDGIVGVWDAKKAGLQSSGLAGLITGLVPSWGSGGCPSFSLPDTSIMGISTGGSLSVPCYVWDIIRAIMMISALVAARRIIFGG